MFDDLRKYNEFEFEYVDDATLYLTISTKIAKEIIHLDPSGHRFSMNPIMDKKIVRKIIERSKECQEDHYKFSIIREIIDCYKVIDKDVVDDIISVMDGMHDEYAIWKCIDSLTTQSGSNSIEVSHAKRLLPMLTRFVYSADWAVTAMIKKIISSEEPDLSCLEDVYKNLMRSSNIVKQRKINSDNSEDMKRDEIIPVCQTFACILPYMTLKREQIDELIPVFQMNINFNHNPNVLKYYQDLLSKQPNCTAADLDSLMSDFAKEPLVITPIEKMADNNTSYQKKLV